MVRNLVLKRACSIVYVRKNTCPAFLRRHSTLYEHDQARRVAVHARKTGHMPGLTPMHRQFTPVPSTDDNEQHVTVVTYNILADKYANSGQHKYCQAAYLKWEHRKALLFQELQLYNADILCLQEVEKPTFETEIQPFLSSHGYQATYAGRQMRGKRTVQGPEEGLVLAFKGDRFEQVAAQSVRFGDLVSEAALASTRPKDVTFWNRVAVREDIAAFALLRDRSAGDRPLLAACTHLFWNPTWPDVKAAQAHLLCQALAGFAKMHGHPDGLPTVIGGDFNSLWRKYQSDKWDEVPTGSHLESGVYRLLSTGKLEPSHHDHPLVRRKAEGLDPQQVDFSTSGLQLASLNAAAAAATAAGSEGSATPREPPLTTVTADFHGCLDYIWLSHPHFRVASALSMPYDAAAAEAAVVAGGGVPGVQLPGPWPSREFPSDHIAVGGRLVYAD